MNVPVLGEEVVNHFSKNKAFLRPQEQCICLWSSNLGSHCTTRKHWMKKAGNLVKISGEQSYERSRRRSLRPRQAEVMQEEG